MHTCAKCNDSGSIYLGSQPYGMPGESYAPCDCPAGDRWIAEQKAFFERQVLVTANAEQAVVEAGNNLPERCPVCGGLNPGDITHTRC